MGLFSSKKSASTTQATTNTAGLNEISGQAAAINGSGNSVQFLDAGAVSKAFSFADSALEKTANLTLDLVSKQDDTTRKLFAETTQATSQAANQAYQFAMDAGRSETKLIQDGGKLVLYVVGMMAGAFVLVKWGARA